MKYLFFFITISYLMFSSGSYAQEANDLAPPPPPELNEENQELNKAPPKKKKKLKHCGPTTAKLCDQVEKIEDISDYAWRVGAMGAALCSQSAAIEATRKQRKDKIEYEKRLERIAKDEGKKYKPWKPSETNSTFAKRTSNECVSNMKYWCEEMKIAAAEINDSDTQMEAMGIVDKACN
ncbi:MAG: hypothetical protein VX397_01350 [Pseudomonadota bacterium]|nr:hypothetical protein [Pseudomonadota bacterium]